MKEGLQKGWANLCLLFSVFVTVFLASFTLASLVWSYLLPENCLEVSLGVSLGLASCCAVAVSAVLAGWLAVLAVLGKVTELKSQI